MQMADQSESRDVRAVLTPISTMISPARRFSAAMERVNSSTVSGLHVPRFMAVEIMPVPICLVRINSSPGRALVLS